jgi:hypothetical protein
LLHASLGESKIISMLLAGLVALNGYLAVRNFAFTFFGPATPASDAIDVPTLKSMATRSAPGG